MTVSGSNYEMIAPISVNVQSQANSVTYSNIKIYVNFDNTQTSIVGLVRQQLTPLTITDVEIHFSLSSNLDISIAGLVWESTADLIVAGVTITVS